MPDYLTWPLVLLALAGNVLLLRKSRATFVLWAVADVGLIAHNLLVRDWPQAALFAVYLGLAVWGWVAWGTGEKAIGH
jgi:nicotinamide riboside transporter PnuC